MGLLDELPHRCTIGRRIRETDTLGGNRDRFVEEISDVPCWIQQAGASEISEFERRGQKVTMKVYFCEDHGLTPRNQLKITDYGTGAIPEENQPIWDVVNTPLPDVGAGLGVVWKAMVDDRNQD